MNLHEIILKKISKKVIIKNIFSIIFLAILFINGAFAQKTDFNTDWYSEDDYKFVEKNIYENILWLENDPTKQNDSLRQCISNVVLKWIMGTQYLIVDIDVEYMKFIPKDYKYIDYINPMFVFGKAKYIIDNIDNKNEQTANIAGLKSMLKIYNYVVKKDRKAKLDIFEKLKKYDKANTHIDFINEFIKVKK
ncbi:MAG: hypothetical protein A2X12_04405 [Bacteroidetes bacterium GWE2_29_8]|nr:MAG: hypothetical protein A2X12_04405 [Bacteroidetes bacterium GWE2_29_8]OFY18046.1 MAG: hypothetical protein A2X02_09785 [Bacteroidetes bacterium GWF2_29_10]